MQQPPQRLKPISAKGGPRQDALVSNQNNNNGGIVSARRVKTAGAPSRKPQTPRGNNSSQREVTPREHASNQEEVLPSQSLNDNNPMNSRGVVQLVDASSALSVSSEMDIIAEEIETISTNEEYRSQPNDVSLDSKVSNIEKTLCSNKLSSQILTELGELQDENTDTFIDEEHELEKKKLIVLKDLQKKYPQFSSLRDQPLLVPFKPLADSAPTTPTPIPPKASEDEEEGDEQEEDGDENETKKQQTVTSPTTNEQQQYEKQQYERSIMGNATLAEILMELELEKVEKKRDEILNAKSSILTSSAATTYNFSSISSDLQRKSYLDYRKERNETLLQLEKLPTVSFKEPSHISAEKQLNFCLEKKNTKAYMENFVLSFTITGKKFKNYNVTKSLQDGKIFRSFGHDQTGQEFLYLVRNKFDAIFKAQSAKLKVLPYPYKENVNNDNSGLGGEKKTDLASDTFTYLKESTWTNDPSYKSSKVFFPPQDAFEQKQTILMTNDLRIDPQLQIEAGFLHTTELQYARKRLKDQADSHFKRARVEDEVQTYLEEGYIAERKLPHNNEEDSNKEYEHSCSRLKEISSEIRSNHPKNIIKVTDLQTIIRKQLYDARARRKVDQFLLKSKWLPYSERRTLFKKAFDIPNVQTDARAPGISVVKSEIEEQLETLKDCVEMKKLPSEETGQEFLYLVRNKFDAIFKAQSAKLKVLPYPYKENVNNDNSGLGGEKKTDLASDTFTYLKESTWTNDPSYKSSKRLGFLHTTELQYARKRLKDQADSHFKRARVEDEVQTYLEEGYIAERKLPHNNEEDSNVEGKRFRIRSIEKRLYFDHIGYLATTENASSSFIRKFFVSSDDLEKLASTDSLPLNATFRDDKYSLHLKRDVVVRDANGLKIMYDAALKDYELLEERLLKIGSYFIEKNLSSFPKLQVDRFVVLEGLLESETWFQDSKRKVIDCYMEAYEHCYEPKEQLRLASAIMQIMKKTPKFNLESHYFSESYASEIICLELYHSLLKDILKEQIRDEKDYLSFIYEAIDPSTERSGFPDNVTLDNFAQTELFPGSSKVGFLDFYTSTSIIGRIHEHLEKAVNNITNSFKFKNVLSLNAVRRSVLQQLIVEWKLIAKEEKIQKAIKSKLSEERSAIEDTNILEDPNELIFLLNTVIDTEKMPKHNTDDQENMITRDTEGGFSMAEKDSIPLQYFSNLVEMITIWKHLTKELLETDILTAIFNSQATLVGTAQQSMNSALGPLNFDTKDALNDSQHSFPEMKTQYLTNLAIVEFDSSMAEANFNSFDGIKRLVGLVGLFELRHLYQYQMLQKILYETAVKYNQTPLDDYYVAQEKKEFFVTSMNTQNDTSQYITKEVLQELFLTFNNMKIPIRQRILKEYQKLSEGIIKSKRANVVRKYLRDLKFRLSASFCTSMLSTIQPYILKCDIIDVVRELRATLGAVSVGSGFLIGKPDHNVQISSHGVVSKNKDDHANKCVMAKDGEVVNVTYVPHFIQIMRTSFIQANEEENTMTDNFYNLLQILQRTFIILKFWAISIQATAKLYDIIINEGYGLEKGLETYCKSLTSELEHLRQPENPASVISYLTLKCETLLLKYILILDNLKHKLRKEGMRSCMIAENYLQKLHDSERNYFSAEDANVTLYMEELLTEEKVYPNSMPEQAVKMQFDFLKTSVLMYKLRDYFLDLSCNGSKLMLQDEAKMEDLYNHIIFKKSQKNL
ncbi:hypothetical protein FDP41_009592 [Naegleria fowleri]|uniref:Uncharacterized protein n=1 Tax=Naegleria fowleri TaxID=5763 RepID=A0A6A5BB10_NAEFO|nr:uncharacterized protein FDP41_009592 [Naegleria fowleri]KAF0971896.1 hypothetical protein FDP41_009592 [Naegleria fowleri]